MDGGGCTCQIWNPTLRAKVEGWLLKWHVHVNMETYLKKIWHFVGGRYSLLVNSVTFYVWYFSLQFLNLFIWTLLPLYPLCFITLISCILYYNHLSFCTLFTIFSTILWFSIIICIYMCYSIQINDAVYICYSIQMDDVMVCRAQL